MELLENESDIIEFIEECQREEDFHIELIREMMQEIEHQIDLDTEKIFSRWLKQNKHFRRVKTREEATAIFIFHREDLSRYNLIYNNDINDKIEKLINDKSLTLIYIKNTNLHDKNRATLGHIKRKVASAKKIYN